MIIRDLASSRTATTRIATTWLAVLWIALAAAVAPAQEAGSTPDAPPGAPAGNAHPDANLLSATNETALLNPFGLPANVSPTPSAKRAFAGAVDLEPLRALAVNHNGRVKILDTLARETVASITGRKDFLDLAPKEGGEEDGGGENEKVAYDPIFTLVDLAIDPNFYNDKPLIHIEYLPLRDALLLEAFPTDEGMRKLWNKRTRLSPEMIDAHATPVFNRFGDRPEFRAALHDVEDARRFAALSVANWRVVAPESTTDVWHHPSEFRADSDVRVAMAELGQAWRAADAVRTNAAVVALAELLPTINAELYPTDRRNLELAYNRTNAFEWGAWFYFFALLALVLAFGTGRRWLSVSGTVLLATAMGMHAFGFTARCVIAERFAIQNQFESMTGVALFAAVVGLGLMVWRKQMLFGAAAAGAGFLILIGATQTAIPGDSIEREAAILNTSVLLKYHVTTVLTSYGLITLGMIVSLFYLATTYLTKAKPGQLETSEVTAVATASLGGDGSGGADDEGGKPATRARLLADLDTAQMIVLQLAFWTLGVGILLGAWWADHSWGRWWAFDPKETWALVTWIVYLIVVHVRPTIGGEKKGLTTAWLSVVGFVIMLWTYFGVNLLLPGLHAYA